MFRWQAPRSRTARNAFTVIELVVVLMILGIVAAATAPSFYRSLHHHQMESAARRIKADLELVQHTARLTSRSQSITFTDRTYTLSADVVDLDHPDAAYFVDLAASPFELDDVTLDFGGPTTITFNGFGTPSAGGTIVLTKGDEQRTVVLNQSTGQATISIE